MQTTDLEREVEQDLELLSRGAAEIISREDLRAKLLKSRQSGQPLRIKLGLDPTAPHIHLGFAVVLRKLRQFQDLGHHVVMLIGDFTARVGDPSGVSETRKVLTPEEIDENARTYREQFTQILDPQKTEVAFNSTWLGALGFAEILGLTAKYTVARILERDDFEKRYREQRPIHMHEMLYPLMQGYDSVALRSDVELGGTDQKFNILVGRDLQREYGQEPQVVFTMPILVGLDGKDKMSKSKGNYVGITMPPEEMFGKLMSMPDHCMRDYYVLCTSVPLAEIDALMKGVEDGSIHPMEAKKRLGREIVAIYHGAEAAAPAQEKFEAQFSRGEIPQDMPDVRITTTQVDASGAVSVIQVLIECKMADSNRDARRLIEQGAVTLDGEKVTDPRAAVVIKEGAVLKVGARKYARLHT
jgi:tyrosyl-tRNA synthetase